MGRWLKASVVVLGYAGAIAAGMAASWLHDRWLSAQPYDTSGGMYAAGVSMTGIGTFLLVALVPTLMALWFLRRNEPVWNGVAVASLAFAIVGLAGVLVTMSMRTGPQTLGLVLLTLLGLAQMLGVPLWTAAFVLFAFLAPSRIARRLLVAAVLTEVVIGMCAFVHFFVRPMMLGA